MQIRSNIRKDFDCNKYVARNRMSENPRKRMSENLEVNFTMIGINEIFSLTGSIKTLREKESRTKTLKKTNKVIFNIDGGTIKSMQCLS